ncbi:hypothetical protein PGT21_050004 [Puccinia graminis f. sp. tritici]|uniref:CCHC-type domain-containing protein n=1 Tax=Puccinia graminis f. sp. tritici TaxID=56615 RepID=A0A5B0RDG7_PUCGR|nr:hypothetical protein PGT21_050004 [Puccinia graminis f. sp. tritici]KAA1123248.1 hypothetical protein PGTUg99_050068 [Puccinia graminis f. sp. tritici]
MLRLLDATWMEQKLADENKMADTNSLRVEVAPRSNSGSEDLSEIQEIGAMAISRASRCYICKKTGHIAPNCPAKKRGVVNPARPSVNPNTSRTFPPCSVTYNFDKMPYIRPLQPEAKNDKQIQPRPEQPTALPQTVNAKLINPDIFAEEDDATHVFETEDLSAEPSGNRFNLRELAVDHQGQEVIWDSGASDNVTGDRHGYFEILRDEQNNHRS